MDERPVGSSYLLSDERLGAGGMGTVYRGRDRQGHDYAIKLIRPELAEDARLVQKFVQERSSLTGVDHPHVVVMHDLVVEGDTLAIVMELVEGHDLRAELGTRGPLPPAEVSSIGGAVASGLAAVHAAGLIHRDLKPENVMLDLSEGRRVPKVADFGIARIADSAASTRSTVPMATPNYSAPEIAEGKVPTSAADVYSLGIMLYELACGVTPFQGGSQLAVVRRHADDGIPRPEGIPDELWRAIVDMVAKDPSARPTAEQVRRHLTKLGPRLTGQAAAPQLTDPLPTVPLVPTEATTQAATLPADAASTPTVALDSATAQTSASPGGPSPAATASRPEAGRNGRPRRVRRLVTVAAVLMVIVGAGGVLAYTQLGSEDEPESALDTSAGASTADGVAAQPSEAPDEELVEVAEGAVADPAEESTTAGPTTSPAPTPEEAPVTPDLVGTSLSEAQLDLPGTEISVIEQLDAETPDNTILAQSTPAGEELPESIEVTVARQPVTVHLDTLEMVDGHDFRDELAQIEGDAYPRSLTSNGYRGQGFGEWNLGRGYREMVATVGRSDDAQRAGATVQVDVYLDGRSVWSEKVQLGDPVEMRIDVSDALRLRIEFSSLEEDTRADLVLGDIQMLGLPEEVPEPVDE